MIQNTKFVSIFKINNKPIISPVITEELRKEILEIRNICKTKEEKIKQRKDELNYSKKAEDDRCCSSNSYTISNPVFQVSQLPEACGESEDDAPSIQTEINDDKNVSSMPKEKLVKESNELFQPNLKNQMKSLIDKQKEEYLKTMDELKHKFIFQQQDLFTKLQSNMQNLTSTPLTNNSFAITEDEEFTEFQTCLQSFDKSSSEKTLVCETNIKDQAATKINALARGYLVRRLIKTVYAQEIIKSIQDTLNFVFSLNQHKLGGSPIQDILLKTKLFKQLSSDLHRFNDIFHKYTPEERMRMISNDRDYRRKQIVEKRMEYLNRSF